MQLVIAHVLKMKQISTITLSLFIFIISIPLFVVGANSDTLGLADYSSVLFVDTSNGDCSNSYTRTQAMNGSTPWCSLNGFLTSSSSGVTPIEGGDTVYILAGDYNTVDNHYLGNKEFNSNVTIMSYPNNDVSIYNYVEKYAVANSLWENQSTALLNIWNTSLTEIASKYPVFYANGTKFLNDRYYFNETQPVSFMNSTEPYDRIYHDGNELMIRFSDMSINPNNIDLRLANQDGTIRIQNKDGIGYIIFEDLTIKNSKYGFQIRNSSNIVFDNIEIEHALTGFYSTGDTTVENLTIKNSNITGSFIWGWQDMKATYDEGTAIYLASVLEDITIQNNTIQSFANGVAIISSSQYSANDILVTNNTITDLGDDALEIEHYCSNQTWSYNTVYGDVLVGVSLAPAQSDVNSQCSFHHNEIKLSDSSAYNSSTNLTPYAIKVITQVSTNASVSFWDVHHNTFASKNYVYQGLSERVAQNMTWKNNIFYSWSSITLLGMVGESQDGVLFDYNLYYNGAGSFAKRWNNDSDTTVFNTLADAMASANWDGTWDLNSTEADPDFVDLDDFDLRPILGSPACTMSDTGSYVGALACVDLTTPHLELYSGQEIELYSGSYLMVYN